MSTRNKWLIAGAAGLLLAALPAVAQKAKPKTAPTETVTIVNTGSTNTFGYKITMIQTSINYRVDMISDNGTDKGSNYGTLKQMGSHSAHFFKDLDAAMPLSSLPVRHGMRSASFGTQTFIIYKGQKSPDLTFASDPRSVALKADIDALAGLIGASNLSRHPSPPPPLPMMPLLITSPGNSSTRN